MFAGEHHETESAGAQQFVHGAERVHASLRAHEERTLFPERAGDGSGDIYPRGAITVRDNVSHATRNAPPSKNAHGNSAR